MTERKRSFVVYETSISERGKPKTSLPLDNFDGRGSSVLTLFATYLKSMPTDRLIQRTDRYFGQPSAVVGAPCTVRCTIRSGTSGVISRIGKADDSIDGYDREEDDIERITFSVAFVQPPSAHVGFLCIEGVSGRSIGQAFRTTFLDLVRRRHPEVILSLARTAETDAWRAAEEAGGTLSITQVTAIHRGIDASAMSDFGIGGRTRKIGEYQRILKFKGDPENGTALKKLRETFFPPTPSREVDAKGGSVSFSQSHDGGTDPDEPDEIVAEVSYPGGGKKAIRCSGARPPLITYPIDRVGEETDEDAFVRETREVVRNLSQATDVTLPEKWDDRDSGADLDDLSLWATEEFNEAAEPPR